MHQNRRVNLQTVSSQQPTNNLLSSPGHHQLDLAMSTSSAPLQMHLHQSTLHTHHLAHLQNFQQQQQQHLHHFQQLSSNLNIPPQAGSQFIPESSQQHLTFLDNSNLIQKQQQQQPCACCQRQYLLSSTAGNKLINQQRIVLNLPADGQYSAYQQLALSAHAPADRLPPPIQQASATCLLATSDSSQLCSTITGSTMGSSCGIRPRVGSVSYSNQPAPSASSSFITRSTSHSALTNASFNAAPPAPELSANSSPSSTLPGNPIMAPSSTCLSAYHSDSSTLLQPGNSPASSSPAYAPASYTPSLSGSPAHHQYQQQASSKSPPAASLSTSTASSSSPATLLSMSPHEALNLGINLEQYISKRNERERSRVRNVNDAFDNLKNSLPLETEKASKRMSKVEILRTAIGYIKNLELVLGDKKHQQENHLADDSRLKDIVMSTEDEEQQLQVNQNQQVSPFFLPSTNKQQSQSVEQQAVEQQSSEHQNYMIDFMRNLEFDQFQEQQKQPYY